MADLCPCVAPHPPPAPGLWVSHRIIITPRLLEYCLYIQNPKTIALYTDKYILLNVRHIKTIRHNQCHIIRHQWPRVTGAGHGI